MHKVVYVDDETGMKILVSEYREAVNNGYDGEDYSSKPVRWIYIETKSERTIKSFYFSGAVINRIKGSTADRRKHVEIAKKWLHEYAFAAKYIDKRYGYGCNHLYKDFRCPQMVSSSEGKALCCISPIYHGFAQSFGGLRSVPKDLACDLFKIFGDRSKEYGNSDFDVPGCALTMRELWECFTGKATEYIKAETKGEW